MKNSLRVFVVDDHEAIIEMMTPVIESTAGFSVVGHATNSEEAVARCRQLHPDVLILDLVLRKDSGLALLEVLRRVCPLIRVLVFSGNVWSTAIRGVLAAGVHGVVDKMASLVEFRSALQAVADGRVYFSPYVSEQIKELVAQRSEPVKPAVALTLREKDILRRLAQGFKPREIAAALDISVYTVINHRSNLIRKIGLRGAAQISLYAAQIGITGDVNVADPVPAQ